MAEIKITIPDAKLNSIIDGFAKQYNYQVKIDDGSDKQIDNPVTKAQFAKNIIVSFIKDVYVASQVKDLEVTKQSVINSAFNDVKDISVL